MKLFKMLNQLSSEDDINRLILQRLSIIEVIAAFKFGRLPIEDRKQELIIIEKIKLKCIKQHVPLWQIKQIVTIIQCNIILAKMIQSCCFQDWLHRPVTNMYPIALKVSRELLREIPANQIDRDNALQYLRVYLNKITTELLFYLINPPKNISLKKTTQFLVNCFPRLDKNELELLMMHMTFHIEHLHNVR